MRNGCCVRNSRVSEGRVCPAICEYDHFQISLMQRTAAMRAATAASELGDECFLWAVQVRPRSSQVFLVYSAFVSGAKQCQNVLAVIDTSTAAVRQEKADDAVDRR